MNKKFFAVLVALLLLVSMTVPVLATVTPYGSTIYLGDLYIVASTDCDSSSGSANIAGHAFLVYENWSGSTQYFGDMAVPHGKQITIGTTGIEPAHDGVWYNLEAYYHKLKNDFDSNYYYHTYLYDDDLVKIRQIISNWEPYNLYSNNCVHFASVIWNNVSDVHFGAAVPTVLLDQIRTKSPNTINFELNYQSKIGYFDDHGTFHDCY